MVSHARSESFERAEMVGERVSKCSQLADNISGYVKRVLFIVDPYRVAAAIINVSVRLVSDGGLPDSRVRRVFTHRKPHVHPLRMRNAIFSFAHSLHLSESRTKRLFELVGFPQRKLTSSVTTGTAIFFCDL
jgi:hypothetical protein